MVNGKVKVLEPKEADVLLRALEYWENSQSSTRQEMRILRTIYQEIRGRGMGYQSDVHLVRRHL